MWTVSIAMMGCSWLSYVDRQILATLSVVILADTGMSTEHYTEVVSAFSIAYMLGNPLWGSLLDYVGLRTGMLSAVAIWSVASAAHSLVGQGAAAFLGLAAARALLGFGEGATFPGGFRTAMDSLPPDRQARGIAISYSGGSLGAIVTPFLVIPIAARFGWRSAFLVTGALGLAWLVLWAKVARPPYLPLPERRPKKIVWPNFFERRFWALVCGYSLGAFALGPILYLSSLYLNRVFGVSQTDLKFYLWVPPAGWEAGYFFWGWAADRYASGKNRPAGMFVLLTALQLPLAMVTWLTSPLLAVLVFFWSMFVAAGFIVVALRAASRAYPAGQTALVAGLGAGTWSALVAMLLPLLGRWFDQQRYTETFLLVALVPVIGTVLWLWLTRPTGSSRDSVSDTAAGSRIRR
jgi:ACS family hexuronate transporter-like MFS transporter